MTEAPAGTPARERVDAVAGTLDGFLLAEIDLELRGEGDVLGDAQSGARSSLRLLRVVADADLIAAGADRGRARARGGSRPARVIPASTAALERRVGHGGARGPGEELTRPSRLDAMSSRIAVVPGSFDPPTLGHLDVIRRAATLYDELHVLVVHNPGKEAMLPIAQRLALLEQSIAEGDVDGNVIVASWSMGLLVDYATDVGAGVLVKGIRSQVDVAYETPMAIVNRHLAHVETVFLLPDPAHALVSSSLVRQVASLGGDVSPFVPPAVARFLDTGARDI